MDASHFSPSRQIAKSKSPKKEHESQQLILHTSFSSPTQHLSDAKDNGRERLKRHREEVAGHVRIPDKWSQETFLKDWMDYSSFDKLLAPIGLASAREALMAEGRRATSQRLRIESRCY